MGAGHDLDLQGISFCGEDRDLQLSYTVTMGARASTYKFAGNTVLSTTAVKANIKGRFYIVAAGTFSTKGLWEYKR